MFFFCQFCARPLDEADVIIQIKSNFACSPLDKVMLSLLFQSSVETSIPKCCLFSQLWLRLRLVGDDFPLGASDNAGAALKSQ